MSDFDYDADEVDVSLFQPDNPDSDSMDYEDNTLPQTNTEGRTIISLSVAQFVSLAKELIESDNIDELSSFVLNGIHGDIQYLVDPIKNALHRGHPLEATRDYDSVLGIDDNICVNCELTVYPVAKFVDTLTRNIHIGVDIVNAFVRVLFYEFRHKFYKCCRENILIPRYTRFPTFS